MDERQILLRDDQMENLTEAQEKICKELTGDDLEVREEFLKHFRKEVIEFSEGMAEAFLNWRTLDEDAATNDKLAFLSAFVFTSINLHILSMKLFLSGHLVASGNLFRQVLETITLALLSSGKNLNILEQFMKKQYSMKEKSIRDLKRNSSNLGLEKKAIDAICNAYNQYHEYSHLSYLTIGSGASFSNKKLYVGGSFDEGKIELYEEELSRRLSLSNVFSNFIDAVKENFSKW